MPASWTDAERVAAPLADVERLWLGERSTPLQHVLEERSSFEELHDQVRRTRLLEDLVHPHDPRMGEAGENRRFPEEPPFRRGEGFHAVGRRRDDTALADGAVVEQLLERDRTLQPMIVRGVRDAEAAAAERALDDEAARLQRRTARQLERDCVRRRRREVAHRRSEACPVTVAVRSGLWGRRPSTPS